MVNELGRRQPVEYFGRCPKCERWRGIVPDFVPFVDSELLAICKPDNELFCKKDEDAIMGR